MQKITKQELSRLFDESGFVTDGQNFAQFTCGGSSLGLGFSGVIRFDVYDKNESDKPVFVVEINDQAYKTEDKNEAIAFYSDFICENLTYLDFICIARTKVYQALGTDEDEITIYRTEGEDEFYEASDLPEGVLAELRDRAIKTYVGVVGHNFCDLQNKMKTIIDNELAYFCYCFIAV
jgi:hypothetical protein